MLGGGVMAGYRSLMEVLSSPLETARRHLPPGTTKLVEAKLGERAGVVGAAFAALSSNKPPQLWRTLWLFTNLS